MSRKMIPVAKAAVVLLWVVSIAAWFAAPESTFRIVGTTLFWLLLAAHLIECGIFFGALRRSGKPLPGQLARVLVFGVVHYQQLRSERDQGPSPLSS